MTTREMLIPKTATKPQVGRVWGWVRGAVLLTIGLPLVLVAALLEGGMAYPEE